MSADESEQRTRAQVWESVRSLSDADLARVQQLLLAAPSSVDPVRIALTLADDGDKQPRAAALKTADADDNQADNDVTKAARVTQWSPSDLIHAFLGHLHHAVHSQQAASGGSAAGDTSGSPVAKNAEESNAQRGTKSASHSSSSSSKGSSPFALQNEDFPTLLRAPTTKTALATAPHKPSVKTAKRRITTTLLSEQNVITRPVLNAVAFPPLGGASDAAARPPSSNNSNPWAKRELLERRMMSAVEPGSSAAAPETPEQSPVVAKSRTAQHDKTAETRDSSAAKTQQRKLFDDSPPGGARRVQPFPVDTQLPPATDPSAAPSASCLSPVVTTPLKSSSRVQQPPPLLLCVKPKRPRRQSLLSTTADAPSSSPSLLFSSAGEAEPTNQSQQQQSKMRTAQEFATNVQAAKLYAFLIAKRLVGSTCTELQLLISLLFRTNCAGAPAVASGSEEPAAPDAAAPPTSCACLSEFCWRSHCLSFAAVVFDSIEHVLGSLGSELLHLLTGSLADAEICSNMLERLQQLSQRREELRVEESARIGCKLPVETKASAVRDFALPFCEEVDSRLHYRSPTESVMYSNREKVRDSFLDLLRQFQKQQHSLLGIESANVAASAIENANKLLGEVSPENRWWFAKFFVMELIQVGSNPFGESDKDLVLKIMEDKLVVKNPDRLRKLHRRFSSQKQSTNAPNAPTTTANQAATGSSSSSSNNGGRSNKNQTGHAFSSGGGGSHSSGRSSGGGAGKADRSDNSNSRASAASGASPAQNGSSRAITATFETTRGYFAENQQFFFHFLHSCDSYEFSQLVKYQLESQFQSIWRQNAHADARKSFTEVVLKLKVVAKFLGYLRFSPHWHNSSSLVQLSKQNPAFKAAKKEAIWTLENAESVGLDVKLLLEQSIVESKISKCVPWLCDYLTMLSLDKLSLATTYFKQLLVVLERIYHSPRLDALGETGLYIAMQIERVFHVLDFDVTGFLDDAHFRSHALQPPASLLLVLEEVESSVQSGEDNLPFLYSQVFVQSCVSELEDLRGFIQTRAKPLHRVTKRATGSLLAGGPSQSIPIRKLRPLQVVTEEEHNDELLAKASAAQSPSASTLSDDDKLSESIFKIHPNLRKVVEFVVEVVATNTCEHVLQQLVTPSADAFINACVAESGLSTQGERGSLAAAELESATILFLQLLESRTARSILESVGRSLAEASRLCEDKVRASIPHLMPASCHPTLARSVTLVALNRTRGVVRILVPKSSRSEFLKRVAFRKKAVLKETATKSAAQASAATNAASSGAEEDNVVRALSTMFDEHAGVEDSSQDELLLELKRASAQIFKLSTSRHARATADEWTKLHASLSRYVRSFTSSLEELESDGQSCGPEEDASSSMALRKLHELPVWDATWRVLLSCLRVAHSVAEWAADTSSAASSVEAQADTTAALEKSVSGFTDSFISLLKLVLVADPAQENSKQGGAGDDQLEAHRISSLVRVVTDCLLSAPRSAQPDVLSQSERRRALVERLVLSPRARVLAALEAMRSESPASAMLPISRAAKQQQEQLGNQKAAVTTESSLRSELAALARARDC